MLLPTANGSTQLVLCTKPLICILLWCFSQITTVGIITMKYALVHLRHYASILYEYCLPPVTYETPRNITRCGAESMLHTHFFTTSMAFEHPKCERLACKIRSSGVIIKSSRRVRLSLGRLICRYSQTNPVSQLPFLGFRTLRDLRVILIIRLQIHSRQLTVTPCSKSVQLFWGCIRVVCRYNSVQVSIENRYVYPQKTLYRLLFYIQYMIYLMPI